MNVRRIGRIGLIGALAAALASPWRPVAGQQAMTCASEPYLARVVTGGATGTPTAVGPATPAAVASPPASPPASPAGSPAASPAATPRPLTLAWLPGQSEAEATSAAREAATATQARLLEPDSGDPQESLQTAIKGGAQAVVAASKTAAAIAPELTAAAGDGVAIVTLGPDDAADGRTLNVVAPDGPAVATAAAQWLADQLGCAGEVLILSGSSDDAALNDKATAAAAEFAAYGVRVVDVVYGDDDPDLSFTRAAQTMVSYPDLGGILALTPNGVDAAASAVTQLERVGKMTVVGVAASGAATRQPVPIVTANPDDAAYLAIQAAAALVGGTISGAPGEQFSAGALGDVAIGDASVVVAPPIVVVPVVGLGTPSP